MTGRISDLTVGYGPRSWAEQWTDLLASYDALQSLYARPEMSGDDQHARRIVKDFFERCWHVRDWLLGDASTPITQAIFDAFYKGSHTMMLCNTIANSSKHYGRYGKAQPAAQVSEVSLRDSRSITIAYTNPVGTIDALALATDCLAQWRALFASNGIAEP